MLLASFSLRFARFYGAFLTFGILHHVCARLIIEIWIHSADASILVMSCVGYAGAWLETLSSLLKQRLRHGKCSFNFETSWSVPLPSNDNLKNFLRCVCSSNGLENHAEQISNYTMKNFLTDSYFLK